MVLDSNMDAKNSVILVCPGCSVELNVEKDNLPRPVNFSDEADERGWWFSCGKCNCRWWYTYDESLSVREQSEDEAENEKHILELKKILQEFSDYEKTPDVPNITVKGQKNSEQNEDIKHSIVSDELMADIKEQLIKEIKEEIKKEINGYTAGKNIHPEKQKTGFAFFPTKKVKELPTKDRVEGKIENIDKNVDQDNGYSYKRVLPNEFVNIKKTGEFGFEKEAEKSENNKKKTRMFPAFFYGSKKPIEIEEVNKTKEEKISEEENKNDPKDRHVQLSEEIENTERVKPTSEQIINPGLEQISGQQIKSGPEQTESDLRQNKFKLWRTKPASEQVKPTQERMPELEQIINLGSEQIPGQGQVNREPEQIRPAPEQTKFSSEQIKFRPEQVKFNLGQIKFAPERKLEPEQTKRSEQTEVKPEQTKPSLERTKPEQAETRPEQTKLNNKSGSNIEYGSFFMPNSQNQVYIPSKLKNHLRSSVEAKLKKKSHYIAIESDKKPILIPFMKEDERNDMNSLEEKISRFPDIEIPILRERKRKIKKDETIKKKSAKPHSKVFIYSLFLGTITLVTAGALFFTKKHKDVALNLWKYSSVMSKNLNKEKPFLNNVSYSVDNLGQGKSKISVFGEIVNIQDFSVKMNPIAIRVYIGSALIQTWNYFHSQSNILPNEHVVFNTSNVINSMSDSDDVRVEAQILG